MKKLLIVLLMVFTADAYSQNMTDISLQWKGTDKQVGSIESETGNLYTELDHHGPAIENEWLALRLYFDHKVSVDVYNKSRPALELAAAGWYPTIDQQKEGWGSDQYKVGSTVGLGGVRLWDGEKEVFLDPVTKRTARVRKEANISYMEMLSEGVPYMGESIDVLVRVTVFSGFREARVEAFAFSNKPVRFLTGVNYHEGTRTKQGENYICTWGLHPEDVAALPLNIGAAIIYNADDFERITKGAQQFEMISKPTRYMKTWITSAGELESQLNSMDLFVEYLEALEKN